MRVTSHRLATGLPELDARSGGWPRPGVALIQGAPGAGRLTPILPAMGRLTRQGRPVAVVDPVGWLHPPGLVGVALDLLLLVRPGSGQAAWATEQLARCGAVPLVVLLDPPPLRKGGRRLQHAAEAGDSAVIIVSEAPQRDLPASLALDVLSPGRFALRRGDRRGQTGPLVLGHSRGQRQTLQLHPGSQPEPPWTGR
jgi:hypothetical protein